MDSVLWMVAGLVLVGMGWMIGRIAQIKDNKTVRSEVREDEPRLIRRR